MPRDGTSNRPTRKLSVDEPTLPFIDSDKPDYPDTALKNTSEKHGKNAAGKEQVRLLCLAIKLYNQSYLQWHGAETKLLEARKPIPVKTTNNQPAITPEEYGQQLRGERPVPSTSAGIKLVDPKAFESIGTGQDTIKIAHDYPLQYSKYVSVTNDREFFSNIAMKPLFWLKIANSIGDKLLVFRDWVSLFGLDWLEGLGPLAGLPADCLVSKARWLVTIENIADDLLIVDPAIASKSFLKYIARLKPLIRKQRNQLLDAMIARLQLIEDTGNPLHDDPVYHALQHVRQMLPKPNPRVKANKLTTIFHKPFPCIRRMTPETFLSLHQLIFSFGDLRHKTAIKKLAWYQSKLATTFEFIPPKTGALSHGDLHGRYPWPAGKVHEFPIPNELAKAMGTSANGYYRQLAPRLQHFVATILLQDKQLFLPTEGEGVELLASLHNPVPITPQQVANEGVFSKFIKAFSKASAALVAKTIPLTTWETWFTTSLGGKSDTVASGYSDGDLLLIAQGCKQAILPPLFTGSFIKTIRGHLAEWDNKTRTGLTEKYYNQIQKQLNHPKVTDTSLHDFINGILCAHPIKSDRYSPARNRFLWKLYQHWIAFTRLQGLETTLEKEKGELTADTNLIPVSPWLRLALVAGIERQSNCRCRDHTGRNNKASLTARNGQFKNSKALLDTMMAMVKPWGKMAGLWVNCKLYEVYELFNDEDNPEFSKLSPEALIITDIYRVRVAKAMAQRAEYEATSSEPSPSKSPAPAFESPFSTNGIATKTTEVDRKSEKTPIQYATRF